MKTCNQKRIQQGSQTKLKERKIKLTVAYCRNIGKSKDRIEQPASYKFHFFYTNEIKLNRFVFSITPFATEEMVHYPV